MYYLFHDRVYVITNNVAVIVSPFKFVVSTFTTILSTHGKSTKKKEEQKSSNLCSKLQEGCLELHVTSDVDVAKKTLLIVHKGRGVCRWNDWGSNLRSSDWGREIARGGWCTQQQQKADTWYTREGGGKRKGAMLAIANHKAWIDAAVSYHTLCKTYMNGCMWF